MSYKTLIQIFLIFFALIVSSIFYLEYFDKTEVLKNPDQNLNSEINRKPSTEGNTIKEILYESTDSNGNSYVIKSDFGTFNEDKQEEILMTNVTAQITLKNGTSADLKSEKAIYNTINSNTNFFIDVELKYLDHQVNSRNIDVFFTDSKLEAYNDLVYSNSEIDLIADKIELDLLTKNSKIFMFDNSKVKIIKD